LLKYYPLIISTNNHPININIEAVNLKFPNEIDTLKNHIKKTVLLQSSTLSAKVGTPSIVSLKSITQKEDPSKFTYGNKTLAVLLEGEFISAYYQRVKPFNLNNSIEKSNLNKMVVISDGDIIANNIANGQPLELGVDKWTNQQYGNKDFLLNTVNYLLDDTGLLNIRSKKITIDFLNKQKAYKEAKKWQLINILFPLFLLSLGGLIFNYFRKRKYQ